jgi:hypothetical protein
VLGKGSNNSPRVLAGDLGEHREAGIPFDQRGDVCVVRSCAFNRSVQHR